jgi:hypothetical protein
MEGDFDGLKKWVPSLKVGLYAVLAFSIACFVYGWFNNFTFWHAFADAGLNSAIAHTLYYNVFAGPVVFAAAALSAKFIFKK